MNHTLQKAIIEYIFDNLQYFSLHNQVTKEFTAYVYDKDGEYLIGGAQVAGFITKAIKLIQGVNKMQTTQRIGKPLYKPSAVQGHSWHEYLKFGPSDYHVFKVNGDGSATDIYKQTTLVMAQKSCRLLNTPKYTKPADIEFMALEFYYTDDWKLYLYRDQVEALEPRRVER